MTTALARGDGHGHGGVLPAYSTEQQLILACARVALDPPREAQLASLLRQPLDWTEVRRQAQWQRVTGLLFHHLRDRPYKEQVPPAVFAELHAVFLMNTVQHLRNRAELARVLARLTEEGIPVVLLKGSALVGTVYPEAGMRSMGDLDLLVPRARVTDAQAAVQELGYRPAEDGREEHWALHQHLPRLVGVGNSVKVEIHGHVVRLDSRLAFDIAEFWERAHGRDEQGVAAFVFAPEDLVMHLSINFFRDRRFQSKGAVRQLCDLAEVIRRDPSLDWAAIVERGRRLGIAGPLACGLRLVSILLDAPVPDWVVPALAPTLSDADLIVFARLRVVTARQWVATELVNPDVRYGSMNLMLGVIRRIVPDRDYMRVRYGTAGIAGYSRRLGQFVRTLVRFVQRPSELTDDLSVDRWVHSLYHQRRFASTRKTTPGSLSGNRVV